MFEWVSVSDAHCASPECIVDSASIVKEGPWEETSFLPLTGKGGVQCRFTVATEVGYATRGHLMYSGLPPTLGITSPTNTTLVSYDPSGPLNTGATGSVTFTGRERFYNGTRREGKYYLAIPAIGYAVNSDYAGTFAGSSYTVCWSTEPGVGQYLLKGTRSATFVTVNPATLTIAAPATVDFGRVYGGGGEVQMDLPLQLTSNADTRFLLSLSAPALEQNVGSLGSYGYKVLADPSWKDGPSGALNITGGWYDMRMMKGTATYTLRLGLAPTNKPFVAGTHSSNLTVNVRVL